MSVLGAALLPQLMPGARVGPFELVALAGRGGMGEVWLARGPEGDPVALKTLLPTSAADDKARRMFLDESALAARLRHPHIASVGARGEHEGVLYYVMEWVEGASLDELSQAARRQGRPLALPVLLRVLRDAARGLHAAHELRDEAGELLEVVHRDVSPQNILVRRDGVTKVTDFGIARARDRASRTTTGNFRGKLRYVAPEQALGEAPDRRADVWSLGVVLYEALAGETPFESPHQAAVLTRVLMADVAFVFGPEVPRELVALLRRVLTRHPGARLGSAEAFAEALDGVAQRLGLEASPADVAAELEALLGPALVERRALSRRGPLQEATVAEHTSPSRGVPAESGVTRRPGTRLAGRRILWRSVAGAALVAAVAALGAARGRNATTSAPEPAASPTTPPRREAPAAPAAAATTPSASAVVLPAAAAMTPAPTAQPAAHPPLPRRRTPPPAASSQAPWSSRRAGEDDPGF